MRGFIRQLPEARREIRHAADQEQRRVLALLDNKAKLAHGHGRRLATEEAESGYGPAAGAQEASGAKPRESNLLCQVPVTGYMGPRTAAEAFAIHEALRELAEEIKRGYRR